MKDTFAKRLLTVVMSLVSAVYLIPIFTVVMNSFKTKTAISASPFSLPDENTFVGLDNFTRGIDFGGYPFAKSAFYSLIITVLSTAVILLWERYRA